MQTLVGSAFHTPVFSNSGARAGGRWRISGPGATPLTAAGSPGVAVSAVGWTGRAGCAPPKPGRTPIPSASAPNVTVQFRNRFIPLDPLAAIRA
jgi:hypothetical protein